MLKTGYKVSRQTIDKNLIQECQDILPMILTDKKYIDTGVTFHNLFKSKADRFPDIDLNAINKNDLFIISNPCDDYLEVRNILLSDTLWSFAASCLGQPVDNISFSFMNITRKPAKYGPSINWHRDFANKMTSTTSSSDMLRVIIPLESYEENNGAAAIVPDSHLLDDNIVLDDVRIDTEYCNANNKSIRLIPGNMLAIHSKLIHGGGVNRSSMERNNLIFQFVKKGSEHMYENKDEPFHNLGLNEIKNMLLSK